MKAFQTKEYRFEDAAHLARRTGFGASFEEIEELRRLGPELAVEKRLSFSQNDGSNPNPHDFRPILEDATRLGAAQGKAIAVLQGWWMHKLLSSREPLKEKLTLFWHGHFATGLDKVRSAYMLEKQNELFRQKGLGDFQDLVLEVSRDPAMLVYLDNAKNDKKHPNENYARELMELFTMGVHGGYGERDVREAARAFTGWGLAKNPNKGEARNPNFDFKPNQHDNGQKTVLETSGNLDGTDVVRIVCEHPSSARFITAKLWRFFVSEELPEATHNELIEVWQQRRGNIRHFLRELFGSAAFYAPENRQALIKSPLEFVVGALRSSRAQLEPGQEIALAANITGRMAQTLFYPPNVKGWDGGFEWIADGTILARMTFVGMLQMGRMASRDPSQEKPDRGQQPLTAHWPLGKTLEATIDLIGQQFLGETPSGTLRKSLEAYAKGRNTPEVAKGLAYLVLISPQQQLN